LSAAFSRQGAQPRGWFEDRFVDIGFEKNAFLHYWTSCEQALTAAWKSSSARAERRKPRITQKDIPRLYPPSSEIIVQVTKGPIGHQRPTRHDQSGFAGRYSCCCRIRTKAASRGKIENQQERQRLRKSCALTIPEGMGVIMRTVGEASVALFCA